MVSRWLVTGGCGFIGTALCARLLAEGQRVRVLDNVSVGSADSLPGPYRAIGIDACAGGWDDLQLLVGDIRDAEIAAASAIGADVIVHLAANTGVTPSIENPRQDCVSNVVGTLNMLEAARICGVRRFVFASSGAPLGEQQPPLHEEMAPHPMSPYGASKLAGEGYCSAYWHSFKIETVALRFGNVYGHGSKHKQSVVAKFFSQAILGQPLEVYGDGAQTRDFIFLGDLIEAIVHAARRPGLGGQVIQIATGTERTVNEVAEHVARLVTGRFGHQVRIVHRGPRAGEMKRNYADISKARNLLGFAPATSLERGLERTMEYFVASAGKG